MHTSNSFKVNKCYRCLGRGNYCFFFLLIKNTVGHNNPDPAKNLNSLQFTWMAPEKSAGNISFMLVTYTFSLKVIICSLNMLTWGVGRGVGVGT